jgi:hypothetical protein
MRPTKHRPAEHEDEGEHRPRKRDGTSERLDESRKQRVRTSADAAIRFEEETGIPLGDDPPNGYVLLATERWMQFDACRSGKAPRLTKSRRLTSGDSQVVSICTAIFFYLHDLDEAKREWTTQEYRAAARMLRHLSTSLRDVFTTSDNVHVLARQIVDDHLLRRDCEVTPPEPPLIPPDSARIAVLTATERLNAVRAFRGRFDTAALRSRAYPAITDIEKLETIRRTSLDLSETLSKIADVALQRHRAKHRPVDWPLRWLLLCLLGIRGRRSFLTPYEVALLFYAAELHRVQPKWAENAEDRKDVLDFLTVLTNIRRRIELLQKKPIGPLEKMFWEERRRLCRSRTRVRTR